MKNTPTIGIESNESLSKSGDFHRAFKRGEKVSLNEWIVANRHTKEAIRQEKVAAVKEMAEAKVREREMAEKKVRDAEIDAQIEADSDEGLLRAAEELGIDLSGVRDQRQS